MTTLYAGNWVSEHCSTIGISDLILTGVTSADTSRFNDAITNGDVFYVVKDGDDREAGFGVLSPNRIMRNPQATLLNGVYNDSSPVPISLHGFSVVECTSSADTYSRMVAHLEDESNPHSVTKEQVGLGNVDNTSDADKPISDATQAALNGKEDANTNIQEHIASVNNPHSVTKEQVGLGNVDDTSDADKPISDETQDALNDKEDANVNIQAHIASLTNPHQVEPDDIGLGEVDNTSDADKPVSSATQTALNLKANLVSPDFAGVPTAPTATPGTSSLQLATTQFVLANNTEGTLNHDVLTNRDLDSQHPISAITDLQDVLDFKENVFVKNTAFNKNFGSGSGTVAMGNHTHTGEYEPANPDLTNHLVDSNNPHAVTKAQVGLSNVDNTSDINKPVSIATAAQLNLKANINSPTFTGAPKAPTPADNSVPTRLATTQYVHDNSSGGPSGNYAEVFHQLTEPLAFDAGDIWIEGTPA